MVKIESWQPSENVVFSALDNGVALLDTEQNIYYTLNGIGPFLWEQVTEGRNFSELCESVVDHYEVSIETASADIGDWVAEMSAAGLIVEQAHC